MQSLRNRGPCPSVRTESSYFAVDEARRQYELDEWAKRITDDEYDNVSSVSHLEDISHTIIACLFRARIRLQGFCGSLKVLEFFSRFSGPRKSLKTDMALENP